MFEVSNGQFGFACLFVCFFSVRPKPIQHDTSREVERGSGSKIQGRYGI